MTAEELARLKERVETLDQCRVDYDWKLSSILKAAPALIALAEWAEKAKEALYTIGCAKDQYRGSATDCGKYVGLCERCAALAAYPEGE